MLRGLEGWHLVILLLVVLVLFGYKRMPDAARSLGRSMRIFKSEVDTMRKDDDKDAKGESGTPGQPLTGRVVDPPASAQPTQPHPAQTYPTQAAPTQPAPTQPQAAPTQPAPNSESTGDDRR